jgi:hypothetical protein
MLKLKKTGAVKETLPAIFLNNPKQYFFSSKIGCLGELT